MLERPVSVYLTVAPSDLDRMRPLLRIALNEITSQLTREVRPGPAADAADARRVHGAGQARLYAPRIGFFRGYGIRVFLSIQSLE